MHRLETGAPLGGKLEKVSVVLEKKLRARGCVRAVFQIEPICIIHTAAQRWAAN